MKLSMYENLFLVVVFSLCTNLNLLLITNKNHYHIYSFWQISATIYYQHLKTISSTDYIFCVFIFFSITIKILSYDWIDTHNKNSNRQIISFSLFVLFFSLITRYRISMHLHVANVWRVKTCFTNKSIMQFKMHIFELSMPTYFWNFSRIVYFIHFLWLGAYSFENSQKRYF